MVAAGGPQCGPNKSRNVAGRAGCVCLGRQVQTVCVCVCVASVCVQAGSVCSVCVCGGRVVVWVGFNEK